MIVLITILCPDKAALHSIASALDKLNIRYIKEAVAVLVESATVDIGICDSSDAAALLYFKTEGIPVITCGMGAKNTLTLSSFNDGTALITVQRELPFLSGGGEKPEEFSVHFEGDSSPFAVMAVFAVEHLAGPALRDGDQGQT